MSKPERDIFRPRHEPARRIYDTFQREAALRHERDWEDWSGLELSAVWSCARDWAQQHDLPVPTMEQIEMADRMAMGHVDYGAKLAYGVAKALTTRRPEPKEEP